MGDVVQVTIELQPTSGTDKTDAITSGGDIAIALMEAQRDENAPVRITAPPVVSKVSVCGDGICGIDEPGVSGEPDTETTCRIDCPIELGSCPTPSSSELGDPSLPCGGNGFCSLATATCTCFDAFDGDACGHCGGGYRQVGDGCEVIVTRLASYLPSLNSTNSTGGPLNGTAPPFFNGTFAPPPVFNGTFAPPPANGTLNQPPPFAPPFDSPPQTGSPPGESGIEYAKNFTKWSPCSATCGGGRQTRTYTCLENMGSNTWEPVGASHVVPSAHDN
jgi:hypothetical protein